MKSTAALSVIICSLLCTWLPHCCSRTTINQPSKSWALLCQAPLIDYSALGKCSTMRIEPDSIRLPARQKYVVYVFLDKRNNTKSNVKKTHDKEDRSEDVTDKTNWLFITLCTMGCLCKSITNVHF